MIAELAVWIATTESYPTNWLCVKWLQDKYPELSTRTCWRYVTHAHEILQTASGRTIECLRGEQICRLEKIVRNEAVEARERIRAEEVLADILGTNAPQQVQLATVHIQASKNARAIDWNEFARMQAHQVPAVPTSAVPPTIESHAEVKQLPPINVPIEDQPASAQSTAMVQSTGKSTT